MYRHLLNGSRAANRLGSRRAVGTATGTAYGFSRRQVEKRSPALCLDGAVRDACPMPDWPAATAGPRVDPPAGLAGGVTDAGPKGAEDSGEPTAVWLTAESLGAGDPALAAHPDPPAVFVLDEPLLGRLRLSGKRLAGWRRRAARLDVVARHPWPSPRRPGSGSLHSSSAWQKAAAR